MCVYLPGRSLEGDIDAFILENILRLGNLS
jgi:hypothetical protein